MWILPSRGRPALLKEFITAWHKTKASTNLLLILDFDDPQLDEYRKLKLPETWSLQISARSTLTETYNQAFKKYPDQPWYGGLSDDVIPQTDYWDKELIKSCMPNLIAYPNDLLRGAELCTFLVIGGDLVREMGFFILPGLNRLYGDNVWLTIGRKRNALRYRSDIILEHRHFSNGKMAFDETAKKPSANQDRIIYMAWKAEYDPPKPVNIVTVNWRNYLGRGVEYTNILYDSAQRNLSDKQIGKFIVFTDKFEEGYSEGIEQRRLEGGYPGWWNKLNLFKKGVFQEGERIIFMDLDTAIVGGLDELIEYNGQFATLRDFYRPNGLGPAIIMWTPTFETEQIWRHFKEKWYLGMPENYIGYLGGQGDQAIIEECRRDKKLSYVEILQDIYPGSFKSFKAEAQFEIPKGTKIVCFHGLPRPHEVTEGWVPYIWKIGGGSVLELDVVCNVNDEMLNKNIINALTLECENLADQYMNGEIEDVCIVGGGPSLKSSIMELKKRQAEGQIIWALNNSFNYLLEHDIQPHAHIMLDARPENVNFVPESKALKLYASQCHPDVFERALRGPGQVIIWHPYISGIQEKIGDRKVAFIGVGNSVGLKALGLAKLFGFKQVHLFGYDSSYDGENNHAYDQPLNNKERVIEVIVNGQKFKCAPWMATQTEEFKACLNNFINGGMNFTVHGQGLLPYVASLLAA